MLRSRRLLTLLAALALGAFPATALGQSAGDDQYEDPFADEAPSAPAPAPQAEAPSAPAPPATPAPSRAAAQADGADDGVAAPAPAAPVAGDQLPRTGADTGLLASTGALLLVGGVALRLRLRVRPA